MQINPFAIDVVAQEQDTVKKAISLQYDETKVDLNYHFLSEKDAETALKSYGYKVCFVLVSDKELTQKEGQPSYRKVEAVLYWDHAQSKKSGKEIISTYRLTRPFLKEYIEPGDCSLELSEKWLGMQYLKVYVPVMSNSLYEESRRTEVDVDTYHLVLLSPNEIVFLKHKLKK